MPPRKALQTAQQNVKIEWSEVFSNFDGDDALLKAKAAHRVACGVLPTKIVSEIGIAYNTLKAWQEEPSFKNAVEIIKSNFGQYLEAGYNQRLVKAVEWTDWVMSINVLDDNIPDKLKAAILKEQGLTSRQTLESSMPKKTGDAPSHVTVAVLNATPETIKNIVMGRTDFKVIDGEE
jgi:hypothetical protein